MIVKIVKGQTSVEMIIISGVVMVILTTTLAINQDVMTSAYNQFEGKKARTVVDELANMAELIYQEGVGAKTKIFVTMPNDIGSVSISGRTIKIALNNGEVIYRNLDFNVSGSLSTEEGNYWVCMKSMQQNVAIYDCSNSTASVVCGDSVREGDEECDGSDLGNYSSDCSEYPGFDGGTLSCYSNCTFDTSECTVTPPTISIILFNPTTNTSFTQNEFNEFTVNVSCIDVDCENVNVSLDPFAWWNTSWQHRRVINITNKHGSEVLREGYSINFTIDTTTSNGFVANGNDLRIVWLNGTTNIELDRINATPFNSATTLIWFKLQDNISSSGYNDSYYVYYNNSDAGTPPTNRSKVFYFADDFDRSNRDLDGDNEWTKTVFGTFDADVVSSYATFDSTGTWYSTSDDAGWIWQNFTALDDWEATVHVTQDGGAEQYQRIGLGVRNEPTVADSVMFVSLIGGNADNQYGWVLRSSKGGIATWSNWQTITGSIPVYIKMTKIGTSYTVYMHDSNEFGSYSMVDTSQTMTSDNYVGIPAASSTTVSSITDTRCDDFKIRMLLSPEPSVQLGDEENQMEAKGPISMTIGATPFYTNKSSNPFTINLNQDESELVTFWVNATGDVGEIYEFFAFANVTSNMSISDDTDKIEITIVAETDSPASVTNLANQSAGSTWIYWNWTNPSDSDFDHVEVWVNGTFYANVSTPDNYYNATSLASGNWYEIQTRTADTNGNLNQTWVNDTAKTGSAPPENISVFYDGFEGWGSSNCEHNGMWDSCYRGDGNIYRDNDEYNGSRAVRFDNHDADTDYLIKCEDLSSYSKAYVSFWWRKSGLDSGEYGKLDINTTGSGYANIFDSGRGSSSYAEEIIEITSYISSNTCVKFHSLGTSSSDRFFVDDFRIIGET